MNDPKKLDRFRGALLGLAVGDALGSAVEFKARGTFEAVTGMRGGGPFRLEPGEWTDDTSMALCLAESLLACDGFDAGDQMDRYLRWKNAGHLSSNGRCFDIGNTVSAALAQYQSSGDPFAGSTDPWSAGNGSIMRLAPVPLFFHGGRKSVAVHAELSSRTTHAEPKCLDACRLLAAMIDLALEGRTKAEILSPSLHEPYLAGRPLCPEIAALREGSYRDKRSAGIRGSGYVVESLEAALWAFAQSSDFREGALLAVNLGDDADTTGAVYGQLAGACHGAAGIPAEWLATLAHRDLIETFARRLSDRVTAACAPLDPQVPFGRELTE